MMKVDVYLASRRRRIEAALEAVLPDPTTRPQLLSNAIRHAVLAGGKRLRPVLCLAGAEAAGGSIEAAMPVALSVELLHAYTLVHDDLPCMDDDRERRGLPTVHVAFGEDLAVLAGDALQAMAFGLLAQAPEARPGQTAEMLRVLSAAAGPGGVVGGQVEDVRIPAEPSEASIEYIHRHKTADLFAAALRLGALSAGAPFPTVAAMGAFGMHLGLAFQIVDDLMDHAVAPSTDKREANCLSVMSPSIARQRAAEHTAAARSALPAALPGPAEPLTAIADALLDRQT